MQSRCIQVLRLHLLNEGVDVDKRQGWVLDAYCISGKKPDGTNMYDYTVPRCIFTGIACLSLIVALLLKKADKQYGYKLEEPNIQK